MGGGLVNDTTPAQCCHPCVFYILTGQHSSRMRTVRFEPVRLSVSVATTICYSHKSLGRSRKFEHVSSDYYQMPLAGWPGPRVGARGREVGGYVQGVGVQGGRLTEWTE